MAVILRNSCSLLTNAHLTEIDPALMPSLLTAHEKFCRASLSVRQSRVARDCKATMPINDSQAKLHEPQRVCGMTDCMAPELFMKNCKAVLVSSDSSIKPVKVQSTQDILSARHPDW